MFVVELFEVFKGIFECLILNLVFVIDCVVIYVFLLNVMVFGFMWGVIG